MDISIGKITHKINGIAMIIDKYANAVLKQRFKIDYSEFITMIGLVYMQPSSQKQLVEFTSISKAMISRIVLKLKNKGYVTISSLKEDTRQDVLKLTPKGKALVYKATEVLEDLFVKEISPDLSAAELSQFEITLDKILYNFSNSIHESK